MRHRVAGRRLNRSSSHRAAMRRNFICSVIKHERVVTTLVRAKAMRRSVEKVITLGKKKDLARIRRAMALLGDKDVVRKLFDELRPRSKDRPGSPHGARLRHDCGRAAAHWRPRGNPKTKA